VESSAGVSVGATGARGVGFADGKSNRPMQLYRDLGGLLAGLHYCL
jgi:hypothetical protein